MSFHEPLEGVNSQLKIDVMGRWIAEEWLPQHPGQEMVNIWIPEFCVDQIILTKFNPEFDLEGGYRFGGHVQFDCPAVNPIEHYDYSGDWAHRAGAFRYTFTNVETQASTEVLVISSHFTDQGNMVCLACIPRDFVETWVSFSNECNRLNSALEPTQKVVIIGGRSASFVPTTQWEDVILPPKLKTDLLEDVQSFFLKGVDVYKRLNLKPFRKLLLAGVPGTGKTMLCSALAKWAIEREYLVIYISSADQQGSTFSKIQQALSIASSSSYPTLVILEELDAYLHKHEKALVLNVLDGSESFINERGTLLIATTNYPEAIDERILKRPGRLDRIFIIPETRDVGDAEKMLRQYLGAMWQDDHRELVTDLVGYPGAFIREVAVYALTQVAYDDGTELPLQLLSDSFKRLKEQIDARDDFLTRRGRTSLGLSLPSRNNGRE
ncbi:MAG: ATP-binding protein [Anaerolineae bacterium]|nr:ATP-binding protein [Anaerolineae bacterium]